MNHQVGDYVETLNGHSGMIIKIYRVTGAGLAVHLRERDGRIYYCPMNMIKN